MFYMQKSNGLLQNPKVTKILDGKSLDFSQPLDLFKEGEKYKIVESEKPLKRRASSFITKMESPPRSPKGRKFHTDKKTMRKQTSELNLARIKGELKNLNSKLEKIDENVEKAIQEQTQSFEEKKRKKLENQKSQGRSNFILFILFNINI
jgi:hypothetical protein